MTYRTRRPLVLMTVVKDGYKTAARLECIDQPLWPSFSLPWWPTRDGGQRSGVTVPFRQRYSPTPYGRLTKTTCGYQHGTTGGGCLWAVRLGTGTQNKDVTRFYAGGAARLSPNNDMKKGKCTPRVGWLVVQCHVSLGADIVLATRSGSIRRTLMSGSL